MSKVSYLKRLDRLNAHAGKVAGESDMVDEPGMTVREIIESFSRFVADGILSSETLALIRERLASRHHGDPEYRKRSPTKIAIDCLTDEDLSLVGAVLRRKLSDDPDDPHKNMRDFDDYKLVIELFRLLEAEGILSSETIRKARCGSCSMAHIRSCLTPEELHCLIELKRSLLKQKPSEKMPEKTRKLRAYMCAVSDFT